MSRGWGPRTGPPPPEGVHFDYPPAPVSRSPGVLNMPHAAEAPPDHLPDVVHDLPLAGAIAFDQRDALPGAKQESASPDRDRLRRAQDHGLEMRGAIVVDLVVLPDALGEEAVERAHHIQAEPGIGVLVD